MKYLVLCLIVTVLVNSTYAQSNKIAYQAVIRDVSNNLVVNQTVSLKVSILSGSSTGTPVYVEIHGPSTNSDGLVSIELGTGAILAGFWSQIDWSSGPYYLKLETDPSGGTNYTISSTEQLMSVPYTLYAKASASTFTHHLGEYYEGGIIFHLWKDALGVEHGLIADKRDLDSVLNFSNENTTWPTSLIDGLDNCNTVMANSSNAGTAIDVCLSSANENKTDWYLPSINELTMLYKNLYYFNQASLNYQYPVLGGKLGFYYSSTVDPTSSSYVYALDIDVGQIVKIPRQYTPGIAKYYVRAIRRF